MKKTIQVGLYIVCFSLYILLSSCSNFMDDGTRKVQVPLEPVRCIVVLPAGTTVGKNDTVTFNSARELERGAKLATEIMARELSGNPKVRVLTANQVSNLVSEVSGGLSGTVTALGKKLNCDAVLTTTIARFKQREGGEYASESPASVRFNMVLRHVKSGAVLWSADFKETQESLLSNILSFNKAQSRGFKWITVEELLEQGIKERLAQCPYLK